METSSDTQRSLKVLHISTATSWGGGEQQIAYLLGASSVEHFLICPTGSPLYAKMKKSSISPLGYVKRGGIDLGLAFRINHWIKSCNIDVVHAHDSHAHTAVFLSKTLFRWSARLIVHRRVVFKPSTSAWSRWKYMSKLIDQYIAVSHATRNSLMTYGITADKITVIYDGVDPIENSRDKADLRQALDLPLDKIVIGTIGNLNKAKDHGTFIRVAAVLEAEAYDLHYIIIGGDAGEQEHVHKRTHELGLSAKVRFPGFVQHATHYIRAFDLFLFTSIEEGLGTSAIDAMLAGVPVVATKAGGLPEVIEHQQSGLLADVRDVDVLATHCKQILEQPALRQKLMDQGKIRASQFSVSAMRNETCRLYMLLSDVVN